MLRRSCPRNFPYNDRAPDPTRFHNHWADSRRLAFRMGRSNNGWLWNHDLHAYDVPHYAADRIVNRHTRHTANRSQPLDERVRCPWCHTYFDFTYAEFRRDSQLQDLVERHQDSHLPPPGWEADPRPMKGKGVTQYDCRHRFGWMLGEEW
eukprot:TRINITY_DN55755_c0_g1_i1.p2 TRINITY_DN55755_c0_g1~~TRINITY_DN55755_c0_g1_i1.p2  ORF type:complete len:150 (+),score=15.16 TRINITY_DN55755_c0_g1_i1:110-559(+)